MNIELELLMNHSKVTAGVSHWERRDEFLKVCEIGEDTSDFTVLDFEGYFIKVTSEESFDKLVRLLRTDFLSQYRHLLSTDTYIEWDEDDNQIYVR